MMRLVSKGLLCSGHYLAVFAQDLQSTWQPQDMMESKSFDLHCRQDCLREAFMLAMYLIFCSASGSFISTSFRSSLLGLSPFSTRSAGLAVASFLGSPVSCRLFLLFVCPGGC